MLLYFQYKLLLLLTVVCKFRDWKHLQTSLAKFGYFLETFLKINEYRFSLTKLFYKYL